jgi:hypothetical protein
VARSCEHDNVPSRSMKGVEFLDHLSDYKLLKKDSASHSSLKYASILCNFEPVVGLRCSMRSVFQGQLLQPRCPAKSVSGRFDIAKPRRDRGFGAGIANGEHNLCGILYSGITSKSPISQKGKNRLTLWREVLPGIT